MIAHLGLDCLLDSEDEFDVELDRAGRQLLRN
jgi:hypothetical protein